MSILEAFLDSLPSSELNWETLDEPFVTQVVTLHPPAVETPTGVELILGNECEDETKVMGDLERKILKKMCRLEPHTCPTVPEMQAVRPQTEEPLLIEALTH